jgi:hypothetical protein
MEESVDLELVLTRFHRLVKEILQGEVRRTTFQAWEVGFLIDLQACTLIRSRREDALRKYERVVHKQIEHRQMPPIGFSEFLVQRARKPAAPPPTPSIAGADDPPAFHA